MEEKKNYFGIFNSRDCYDDAVVEDYRQMLAESWGCEPDEVSDEEIYDSIWESLGDEKMNLNKEINGRIVAFANLGLWDGRHNAYKKLGSNLNSIFNVGSYDDVEFYADKYNVRATLSHHDGTNYILFRYVEDYYKVDNICNKIYNGEMDEQEFMKATKSIRPFVAKIYGWREFGRQKQVSTNRFK